MTVITEEMTEPFICQDLEDCNSMPWDEVDDERRRKDLAHEYEYFEQSSIDGAPSDEWRRIGQARRKFLLEQDCQKGGTLFDLNTSCDVDRYFQVANRVCRCDAGLRELLQSNERRCTNNSFS